MVVLDDGAYGAEVHKLASAGADTSLVEFGRPHLAEVAVAFGLAGHTPTTLDEFGAAVDAHFAGTGSTLIDVPTSLAILTPPYRRQYRLDAGTE